MEMNASKAARHKILHGKPSLVDKKKYSKSRFCELTTNEIQETLDEALPEKKPQSSGWGNLLFPIKFAKFQMWRSRFYAFMKIT